MRHVRLGSAAAIGAVLLVGGCGGDDNASFPTSAGAVAATQSATAPAPPESSDSGARDSAAGIAEPDAPTRDKYIRSLNAIDPRLVDGNIDRAVSRGLNTCQDLLAKKDYATVIANVRTRFGSDTLTLTTDQADQVFAMANSHLCPKL